MAENQAARRKKARIVADAGRAADSGSGCRRRLVFHLVAVFTLGDGLFGGFAGNVGRLGRLFFSLAAQLRFVLVANTFGHVVSSCGQSKAELATSVAAGGHFEVWSGHAPS
jgi:hypothetical protein